MPQKQRRRQQPRGMLYRGLGTATTKTSMVRTATETSEICQGYGLGGWG